MKDHQLVFLSKMILDLKVIAFHNTKMQGCTELAKAIVKGSEEAEQKGKCIDLKRLIFSNCNITAEKLAALSPALPFMKEVHLSCNKQMGTQGYAELAKTIVKASVEAELKEKCIDLQALDLCNSNITAKKLATLSPALSFVKEVDLSINKQMGTQGYAELAKTIVKASGEAELKGKCIELQTLSLEFC